MGRLFLYFIIWQTKLFRSQDVGTQEQRIHLVQSPTLSPGPQGSDLLYDPKNLLLKMGVK